MGSPSSSPCPPPPPASAIRASLAAPEPRIDAGPRVSQACVTAPRRQGGLSQSEGTVRAALRPAPFRSAEPARPGRREGGTRPQLPQLHALPLPRDLSPRAAPQRAERAAGGGRAGTGGEGESEERAESRARCAAPGPLPAPASARCLQTLAVRGGKRGPCARHASGTAAPPREIRGRVRATVHAGQVSRRPHPTWLYPASHRNFSCSGPAPA